MEVLLAAGAVEGDVSVVDLDLGREKALNVALNNEYIQGKWDYEGLSGILRDLDDDLRRMTFLPEHEMQPLLEADWSPPKVDDSVFSKPKKKPQQVTCPNCSHEFEVD